MRAMPPDHLGLALLRAQRQHLAIYSVAPGAFANLVDHLLRAAVNLRHIRFVEVQHLHTQTPQDAGVTVGLLPADEQGSPTGILGTRDHKRAAEICALSDRYLRISDNRGKLPMACACLGASSYCCGPFGSVGPVL